MNSPDTDPFYDALRNRLHDYEEPLPAGGWAGIAPQLPPSSRPVPPQWRRLARRWLSIPALLILLLSVLVLWRWAQPVIPAQSAEVSRVAGTATETAPLPAPADGGAPKRNEATVSAVAPAAASQPQAKVAVSEKNHSSSARPLLPGRRAPVALPGIASRKKRLTKVGQPVFADSTDTNAAARSVAKASTEVTAWRSKRWTSAPLVAVEPTRRARIARGTATEAPPESAAINHQAFSTPATAEPSAVRLRESVAATTAAPETALSTVPSPAPASGSDALSIQPGTTSAPLSDAASDAAAAPPALSGSPAKLGMPSAAGLPTPLPLTAPADSLRPARPARLSLGLVFGLNSTRRSAGSLPASLASSEQPGPGNSAEVAARYQLSRNVWLRAGAGYAVNRQSVAFTLEKRQARWVPTTQLIVRTIQGRPDTLRVTTYVQRDSVLSQQRQQYRLSQQYFTVPLAGEWRFRTPSRWQPVLSLGATMTWLLRGTYLAQKDDCNCQTETQRGAGAGPLRPASAALTAGVGLDYALGLRSTLLLRPTGTYWLSSSGRMGGGRPLSVGLQVGLLFDTRRSR